MHTYFATWHIWFSMGSHAERSSRWKKITKTTLRILKLYCWITCNLFQVSINFFFLWRWRTSGWVDWSAHNHWCQLYVELRCTRLPRCSPDTMLGTRRRWMYGQWDAYSLICYLVCWLPYCFVGLSCTSTFYIHISYVTIMFCFVLYHISVEISDEISDIIINS